MRLLEEALKTNSPRSGRVKTPLISVLIHGAALGLFLGLFAGAFALNDVWSWSAGIVYIAYDTLLLLFVFIMTLPLARAAPNLSIAAAPGPSLGVIIAAHDEAEVLPVTLRALLAQAESPDCILIADDGSSDDTAKVLWEHFKLEAPISGALSRPSPIEPALIWLRLPHGGKARALNAALLAIETEVVLTVDADTMLEPGAIAAMRQAFGCDPRLVAATGILMPVCGRTASGRLFEWFQRYEYIRNFLSRYAWMRLNSLLLISGAFAGFRRQAVIDVGGFDPDFLVEDYELIHRLRRHAVVAGRDWRTAVIGGALARTEAPGDVGNFLKQRRRWFGGFLQTQFWYRDMVGNPRYGWLGTLMLPVKALDTLQPLYGLTAFGLLILFIATGRGALVIDVFGFMGGKLALDFAFHAWSVHLYHRWIGRKTPASLPSALLAALTEPFGFQILRHLGAALGWIVFLTGHYSWGKQRRLDRTFYVR